ncbi:MAG: phytoene/squalene synthase family protein [Bacteroidales bacterium]|nr:phytoene/squalene synthase family protein [Bacteroidales bacterium]MDD3664091.1 phytoene/squalene synthase family protein [Bacteroidales bacterium]
MMELYHKNNLAVSRITTRNYSTSFSLAVRMLSREYREAVYAIYGFVRYADEIVDTFLTYDRRTLFDEFQDETWKGINRGISTNPILDSFQWVVNRYSIDHELIRSFLYSMELDLEQKVYDEQMLRTYIYGSAEVVGLMCLQVFYHNQPDQYEKLKPTAQKLGEAFQKVNFLRDASDDFEGKGRIYFKNIDFSHFDLATKRRIEAEIEQDFREAYKGIVQLKKEVRFGVYLAYKYYLKLLRKIKDAPPDSILRQRYSVSNPRKILLMLSSFARNQMNLL